MRILFATFAVLLSFTCQSEDLASRVLARLAEHAVVRAHFVQERFHSAMPAPVESRGRMTVSKKHGVIWRIEAPVRAALVFTPTQVIEVGPDGSRRLAGRRGGAVQAEMGRLIRGITAADAAELRDNFELRAEGSVERWKLHLTPRRREMARQLAGIELAGGRHLEAIDVHDASGDRTEIRLRGFSTSAALEPAELAEFRLP